MISRLAISDDWIFFQDLRGGAGSEVGWALRGSNGGVHLMRLHGDHAYDDDLPQKAIKAGADDPGRDFAFAPPRCRLR